MENDRYKDYEDNVSVPFFPRKWLNKFTIFYILAIPTCLLITKYVLHWGILSDEILGDISVLTTLIFTGTFIVGRFIYWRTHKDMKIGKDKLFDEMRHVVEVFENEKRREITWDDFTEKYPQLKPRQ